MMATPRRSPRLAEKRPPDNILTPSRTKLRKALNVPDDDYFLESIRLIESQFSRLNSELTTYELDQKLNRCLLVSRKVKAYSDLLGPYNDIQLMVKPDGSYKLFVYDRVVDEGASLGAIEKGNVLLSKINDYSIVPCPGIFRYSSYKKSIGFDVKKISTCIIPADNARAIDCEVLYQRKQKTACLMCPKCANVKKYLNSMKNRHDSISEEDKVKRASSSSNVPNRYLSPVSKDNKLNNAKTEARSYREKNARLLKKINQYEFDNSQTEELSRLVKLINESDNGTCAPENIYSEAENFGKGKGFMAFFRTKKRTKLGMEAIVGLQLHYESVWVDMCSGLVLNSSCTIWFNFLFNFRYGNISPSPAAYDAFKSLNIVQLPCSKMIRDKMNSQGKNPGINEEDFLQSAKNYESYKKQRKDSGFLTPKGVGVLIWDETKVESGLVWNSSNSSVIGYSVSSEELSNLHDVYDSVDMDEANHKVTYILQFLWRDLTSQFDAIGPYFPLSGSIECRFPHSMVTRTMLAFQQFGFKTRALLCDGASSNLSLLKILCGFQDDDDNSSITSPYFLSPYDGEKVFLVICPSHQLKNMIAALYSSSYQRTKRFCKNEISISWTTIEDIFKMNIKRAKSGLTRRVPGLKYSHVVRDSWTRLNVLPAKIMQQKYMTAAIHELAETCDYDDLAKRHIATAEYLEACKLLFEQGILSHSIIDNGHSQVLENMKDEMVAADHDLRNPKQQLFLAWQTYDLLNIMYHGFTGLCNYIISEYPGHLTSPLRINGSGIESMFSSLKYIAGSHLSATNYSSSLGMLITQKHTTNPSSEKGYRTVPLSLK